MQPFFSVISAVYNVEKYLPEFLASLEAQTFSIDKLEIILVDDGSTDTSGSICEEFCDRHPNVKVIHKENGGQASARNLGLSHATGTWVTFPDPDDFVNPAYFQVAFEQIVSQWRTNKVHFFVARQLILHENSREILDSHPLNDRWRFEDGEMVDLACNPRHFVLFTNSAFLLLEKIRQLKLEFNPKLRYRFEDASLALSYLLRTDPKVYYLSKKAEYIYRKRSDGSSSVQRSFKEEITYETLISEGYLPLFANSASRPTWLQFAVLYDLSWLLKYDMESDIPRMTVKPEVSQHFVCKLKELLSHISVHTIAAYDITWLSWLIRDMLYMLKTSEIPAIRVEQIDTERGIMLLRYVTGIERPTEQVLIDGKSIIPLFDKSSALRVLNERIGTIRRIWVPLPRRKLEVRLNGRSIWLDYHVNTSYCFNERARFKLTRNDLLWRVSDLGQYNSFRKENELSRTYESDERLARRVDRKVKRGLGRDRYNGCWLFMDRIDLAGDNAEHFYRWVRACHPEHKIFFVIEKSSPEWARLKRDGFNLIDFGSEEYQVAALLARVMISSNIDWAQTTGPGTEIFGRRLWKFVFLQHGVIKDDLSKWLNNRQSDLFITSTDFEYSSIVEGENYKHSAKTVSLTGLPRHDTLLRKFRDVEDYPSRYLLVAPTWRHSLMGAVNDGHRVFNPAVLESEYYHRWVDLLRNPGLHSIAERANLEIVFFPHPIFGQYLQYLELPNWVSVKTYARDEIQDYLVRSALMITDYSSIAFNMAYLNKPVLYYQFDAEDFASGLSGTPGYFSYEEHGFGPVTCDLANTIEALESMLFDESVLRPYLERANMTFPVRDGKNSERVYNQILKTLGEQMPEGWQPLTSWSQLRTERGTV